MPHTWKHTPGQALLTLESVSVRVSSIVVVYSMNEVNVYSFSYLVSLQ